MKDSWSKIDKDFNDTIKNLIKICKIDDEKVYFKKLYNVNVKWIL